VGVPVHDGVTEGVAVRVAATVRDGVIVGVLLGAGPGIRTARTTNGKKTGGGSADVVTVWCFSSLIVVAGVSAATGRARVSKSASVSSTRLFIRDTPDSQSTG